MSVMRDNKGTNGNNSFNRRIFLLSAGIVAAIVLAWLRLIDIQVVKHEFYLAQAHNQQGFERQIDPRRGEIYLTGSAGEALLVATNVTKDLVYAVPNQIPDPEATARQLAGLLGLKAVDILDRFRQGNPNYVIIKKQLDDETSQRVRMAALPGVYLEPQTIRFYPERDLASHVLGFLGFRGDERVGQYGIEGRFEDNLVGMSGNLGSVKDLAGRWIALATRQVVPATNGDNIFLTIDPAIQFKAQEVLTQTTTLHGAKSGSVIVLDPSSGAILALAVTPSFDPNEYQQVADVGVYSNAVLAADYEPGSIFKPITMAASINEGAVSPETTYDDTGAVEFPENLRIQNSDNEAHGTQSMTQALEQSLNTGAVFAESQLGHKKFKDYVERFGFGQLTRLELPGEVLGNIDNLNKQGDIFFATASFGQGITVTPMQIAAAFAAIANGGRMMKPFVVSKIVHADETQEDFYPQQVAEVISSKTASQVAAMMVNVVEHGHGRRAAVEGYYIAGKTGTAQVPYTDRPGYDPAKNIGSFVGFGPVDDPRFVMLVRIDHPQDVKFAESTAAPAFGEIAQFILNYLQVPPSR